MKTVGIIGGIGPENNAWANLSGCIRWTVRRLKRNAQFVLMPSNNLDTDG